MKKLYITLLTFVLVLSGAVKAQDVMVIEKNDNTTVKYNVDVIKRVYFEKESKLSVNITTLDAEDIGNNTAKVSATFVVKNAAKTFKLGFFVGTNSTLTSSNANLNYNTEITEKELNRTYYVELNKLSDGTKYYYRPYVLYDGSYSYGSTKSFTTKSKNTVATPVDLGLSVKWAAWNVDATKPEELGNRYAWGETEPKSSYTRDNYIDYYYDKLGSNICGTSYDVAHVKWGDGWRLPTVTETRELISRCSIQFYTQNGVNGFLVRGPNGNTVFFPDDDTGATSTITVHYPTGNNYENKATSAYNYGLYIFYNRDKGTMDVKKGDNNASKYFGQYIRPVYTK